MADQHPAPLSRKSVDAAKPPRGLPAVTDQEFLRKLRRYAKRRGGTVEYLPERGKGIHALVRLGDRTTTLRHGEIGQGLLSKMLRDLDIDKKDF